MTTYIMEAKKEQIHLIKFRNNFGGHIEAGDL